MRKDRIKRMEEEMMVRQRESARAISYAGMWLGARWGEEHTEAKSCNVRERAGQLK